MSLQEDSEIIKLQSGILYAFKDYCRDGDEGAFLLFCDLVEELKKLKEEKQ